MKRHTSKEAKDWAKEVLTDRLQSCINNDMKLIKETKIKLEYLYLKSGEVIGWQAVALYNELDARSENLARCKAYAKLLKLHVEV